MSCIRRSGLWMMVALAVSACLAPPAVPSPTPSPQPPTLPPTPTETPIPTPTAFQPAIDLQAFRTIGTSPAAFEPARVLLSGLGPIRALAMDDSGRQLFLVAAAREAGAQFQLFQINLDTGAFALGAPLAAFTRVEGLLVLPVTERPAVLLSGCRSTCGLWRVQADAANPVRLVELPAALAALHFIRDPRGRPLGISGLGPSTAAGTTGLLFPHDFLEAPHPTEFTTSASIVIPPEVPPPVDFLALSVAESYRLYTVAANGQLYYGDLSSDSPEQFTLLPFDLLPTAIAPPIRFVEGPIRLFPDFKREAILIFDELNDPCERYQSRRGENFAIVPIEGQLTLTRTALNQTTTGQFDHATGTFQTESMPGLDYAESFKGRVEPDGTIMGIFVYEFNNCPVTYSFTGQFDVPPQTRTPPILVGRPPVDNEAYALGHLDPTEMLFAPWMTFAGQGPALVALSAADGTGEVTLIFSVGTAVYGSRLLARAARPTSTPAP